MKAQERIAGYAVLTHQMVMQPLSEVVRPTRPRVKPSDKPHLPFIGMEHIEAHTMRLLGTVSASTMKSSAVHFQPGDVLYGRLRPYLNKVYCPDFEGLCSAEFIVFPASENLDGRYLQYFLNSSAFVKYASHLNTGDRPRVDFDQLAPYPFPVAPFDQQKRIVAEIEKQFSRLDEAVANLKRVKANLKRYKAAILKAAVEGRLVETEAELARREGRSYETGEQLLQRILETRRSQWQGKGKYKEPAVPDTTDLAELPEGWVWATLEQLCPTFVDSAHRTPKYGDIGHPALGPRDVVGGDLRLERARLVDDNEYAVQTKRHIPRPGDIVYSRELSLGWGSVVPEDVTLCLSQGMCLFRPDDGVVLSYFIYSLNGPEVRRQATRGSIGSAHPHLNLGDIKAFVFSLPPQPEQHRIVAEVDRSLSILREVEAQVDANLQRAERLRQSVLAHMFNSSIGLA